MKEQFLELLKQVKREGINELIEFIEKTDFFTAPAQNQNPHHKTFFLFHNTFMPPYFLILKSLQEPLPNTLSIPDL